MSTDVLKHTNTLLDKAEPAIEFVTTVDIEEVRAQTEVVWAEHQLIRCHPRLAQLLIAMSLASTSPSGQLSVTPKGFTFLGKLLVDLDTEIVVGRTIADRYVLTDTLASGKNSLTFKATDSRLGRSVVLKFFRPGRGEGIIKNIQQLGRVRGEPVLVNPLDVLSHTVDGGHGAPLALNVIVFPFIDGITLREYLSRESSSNPVVLQAFIEHTCLAMMALNNAGLAHNDLHPNNILVTTESSGRAAFRVIDVSYGADEPSEYEYAPSDIEGFQFIIRLALADIQSRLSRISLRRFLGARLFILIEYILTASDLTFHDIYRELSRGERFAAFNESKRAFIRDTFTPPRDFGILRYEEFSDPKVAMSLFYPYPQLFERLCEFGSTILFGHRGTGKSTYMAAMTFFPQVERMPLDFRESLGVLFACRQGEFRKFSRRYIRSDRKDIQLQIKDILITKIMRKTLGLLAEAVKRKRLAEPQSVGAIAALIMPRLQQSPRLMVSHQLSELESLRTTVLQTEVELIDRLFLQQTSLLPSALLDERHLKAFFIAIRDTFSELNQTRFTVLFDDAGRPNVPAEVQSLICDLMASTNEVYCLKLSAEKRTFAFLTTDKKPIERVHDVRVYTISDYLNLGGGFSNEWQILEEYFRNLVGVRLTVAKFQSSDVRAYLGKEGMRPDELVSRLVKQSHEKPVYSGWRTVWQIADRTMRHLIEMISAIFDDAKITPRSTPHIIQPATQSRQIVRFSSDKLRGLMFLPGAIQIRRRKYPLGKLLYEFAASFGKISRFYLHSPAKGGQPNRRFDERLAIEIDDTLNLKDDARKILDALIQYAVLDDEKMVTAFDDNIRKPVYIFNRVYCPILRISFRRADHWRLSSNRFEELLLDPTGFVRTDARLKKYFKPDKGNDGHLFQ